MLVDRRRGTVPTRRTQGRVSFGAALLLALSLAAAGCGHGGAKDKDDSESGKKEAATPESAARDSGILILDADAMAKSGLAVEPAGPATIDVTLEMPGEVKFDPQ